MVLSERARPQNGSSGNLEAAGTGTSENAGLAGARKCGLTLRSFRKLRSRHGFGRKGTQEKEGPGAEVSGARRWRGCGVASGSRPGRDCACVCRQSPEDGVGNAAADYQVGQVADSLRGGQRLTEGATGRLAALFSTAESRAPPVFVPVPQVSRRPAA